MKRKRKDRKVTKGKKNWERGGFLKKRFDGGKDMPERQKTKKVWLSKGGGKGIP